MNIGRTWIANDFIDNKMQGLSLKAIAVFIAITRHVNKNGKTFVGHRRLGKLCGINKDSVTRAIKELEASDLVRRFNRGNGKASEIQVVTVRNDTHQPSETVRHKEGIKDLYKEEEFISDEQRSKNAKALDQLRKQFAKKQIPGFIKN